MALPERVVAGLSTSSSSPMKASMTSFESSPPQYRWNRFHYHRCFRFHCGHLRRYRRCHRLAMFLSLLFLLIADPVFQDSSEEANVCLAITFTLSFLLFFRCWCSGTRSFLSFVKSSHRSFQA